MDLSQTVWGFNYSEEIFWGHKDTGAEYFNTYENIWNSHNSLFAPLKTMHYWAEKARKKSLVLVDNHEGKKKLWCICLCVWVAEDREEEKNHSKMENLKF